MSLLTSRLPQPQAKSSLPHSPYGSDVMPIQCAQLGRGVRQHGRGGKVQLPGQLHTMSIVEKDVDDSEIREQTYAMNASRVSLSNDRYIALQVIVRNQQQTTKNYLMKLGL